MYSPYRIPGGISAEPRSSRLKDKRKGEGETIIKELFVRDVLQNNDLLHVLGKGSAIVLLPRSSSDFSVCSKLRVGSQQLKVSPEFSLNACNSEGMNSSKGFASDDLVYNRNNGINQVKGFYSVKEKFATLCERNRAFGANGNICTSSSKTMQRDTGIETSREDGLSDQRLFSCVTCGILSFACVAIVQPREQAARYLMTADCSFFNDWIVGSGVTSNKFTVAREDATMPKPSTYTGRFYLFSHCSQKLFFKLSLDLINNGYTSLQLFSVLCHMLIRKYVYLFGQCLCMLKLSFMASLS